MIPLRVEKAFGSFLFFLFHQVDFCRFQVLMVIFVIKESSSYGVCFLIRQGSRENAPNSSSCNYRRGKRRSISVRIDYWGRKWKVGFKEAYRRPPPSSSSQGQRLMVKGHNPSPILFLSSKSQYCGKQEVEKRKRTVAQKAIQSLYIRQHTLDVSWSANIPRLHH